MSAERRPLAHIPELDGIRAIAALLVMCLHFFGTPAFPASVRALAGLGQAGVDLFFVLSGFLITRILLHVRTAEHYYGPFYIRRLLRIFPLYYAFLCIHFFVVPALRGTPIPSWQSQSWSWLYLQNVPMTFPGLPDAGPPHFWSLAVEEHFYLTWPLLVRRASPRQLTAGLALALAGPLLVRVLFAAQGIGSYYFTATRMDAIAYGAVLALLHARQHAPRFVVLWRWALPVLGGLLSATYLVAERGAAWLSVLKPSLLPLFFLSAIAVVLGDPKATLAVRALRASALRAIGKISYGLYVFHPLVFGAVASAFRADSVLLSFALSFGATFAIAYLSYKGFEEPVMRWKRRATYR